MPEAVAIVLPLLNPNELEVRLVDLLVKNGQRVSAGDPLATLETTKSTSTLVSEGAGFIINLQYKEGDTALSGDILCYLADEPYFTPLVSHSTEPSPENLSNRTTKGSLPQGLRITQPALALAQKYGIDLTQLPIDTFVTENKVKKLIDTTANISSVSILSSLPEHFSSTDMIIYGGGGHGKSLIELVRNLEKYHIIGIIDDGIPAGNTIIGIPVLGGHDILTILTARGLHLAVNGVGGIGNLSSRLEVFQIMERSGFSCPPVIHPTAFTEASAIISQGVQVFPHAYIGSSCQIGFGVIVNTGAIISHDCTLEDYVNLSPGAILAGGVTIGQGTLVGMAVTVNLGVTVGKRVKIGNGATIKSDIPEGTIIHAGSVWPSHEIL